jgi:hypothetical protein
MKNKLVKERLSDSSVSLDLSDSSDDSDESELSKYYPKRVIKDIKNIKNIEDKENYLEKELDKSIENNLKSYKNLDDDRKIITQLIIYYNGNNDNLNQKIREFIYKKGVNYYSDELIAIYHYEMFKKFDDIKYFLKIIFDMAYEKEISMDCRIIDAIFENTDDTNNFFAFLSNYDESYLISDKIITYLMNNKNYDFIIHVHKNKLHYKISLNNKLYCKFINLIIKYYDKETMDKIFKYFDKREELNLESDFSLDLMNTDGSSDILFHKLSILCFIRKFHLIMEYIENNKLSENNVNKLFTFIKNMYIEYIHTKYFENEFSNALNEKYLEIDKIFLFLFKNYKVDTNIFDDGSLKIYFRMKLYETLLYLIGIGRVKISEMTEEDFDILIKNIPNKNLLDTNYDILDIEYILENIKLTSSHLEILTKSRPEFMKYLLNYKIKPTQKCFTNLIDKNHDVDYIDQLVYFGYEITHDDIIYATSKGIVLHDSIYTKNFVPDESFYKFCDYDFMPMYNDNMYNDEKWAKRANEIIINNKALSKYGNFIKSLIKIDNKVAINDLCIELEICKNEQNEKNEKK